MGKKEFREKLERNGFFRILLRGYFCLKREILVFIKSRWKAPYNNVIVPFIQERKGLRNTEEMIRFKDIHKGDRCFIVATGPSVRREDIEKIKGELTIGVNSSVFLCREMDWNMSYYMTSDTDFYKKAKDEINFASRYIDEIFLNISSLKQFEGDMSFKPNWYKGYVKGAWSVPGSDKAVKYAEISENVSKKGFSTCRSIMFYALQLAIYMGFSEIYLYGVDCDYTKGKHFNEKDNVDSSNRTDLYYEEFVRDTIGSYEVARKYADSHGIKIYNATRGGKLEVFERVDLDQVLEKEINVC